MTAKTYTNYDTCSKEEATEVFKQMLREKGIDSNWKWDDVNRVIQDDKRVKVFKTIADRKSAFSDYIYEVRNSEKREAREIKQRRRENFSDMLREVHLTKREKISYLSKFY
jgi:pre-mRNA-processing factor 40